MSELLVKAQETKGGGAIVRVTPESAGWEHVGFEALSLGPGEEHGATLVGMEACLVAVEGAFDVETGGDVFPGVGGRTSPWDGPPDAVYLPPGAEYGIRAGAGGCEVGVCTAPAEGKLPARRLSGGELERETRGHGSLERYIYPILMENREAESLLVCEVVTPNGHWSSYPPHKHDRDALPEESFLEETYYHRVRPPEGFALQRIYTDDGQIDESVAVANRDTVLVPRGYHTVSAPPGYDDYYLNVMAGPTRVWGVANDPDLEWTLDPNHESWKR